jgi:hypothetical protein
LPSSWSSSDCASGTFGSVYRSTDHDSSFGRCRIVRYEPLSLYSLQESKKCSLAENAIKTYFCRRWKLLGSSPSLRRYSLYLSPNAPPGKATSFPGNGMTTSNTEYLSTSSSVRVFTRGGCHTFLLPLRPEAGSSGIVVQWDQERL